MSRASRLLRLLVVVSFTALVVHAQVAGTAPPADRGAGLAASAQDERQTSHATDSLASMARAMQEKKVVLEKTSALSTSVLGPAEEQAGEPWSPEPIFEAEFFPEPNVDPDVELEVPPPSFEGKVVIRGPDGEWQDVERLGQEGPVPLLPPGPDIFLADGAETALAINIGDDNNLIGVQNRGYSNTPNLHNSIDGNVSWTARVFPIGGQPNSTYTGQPFDPWANEGNSVDEFFATLIRRDTASANTHCLIARSVDKGATWPLFFERTVNTFQDREMVDVDKTTALGGGAGALHDSKVYMAWDDFGPGGSGYVKSVLTIISPAGGFLNELTISTLANFNGAKSQPLAGVVDGQVYLMGLGQSASGDTRFLSFHEITGAGAGANLNKSNFNFPTTGQALGVTDRWGVNGHRVNSQMAWDIDRTQNARRGYLYVISNRNPNQANPTVDQGDVYLSVSTNGAVTWNSTLIPGQAAGKTTFFSMIDVDVNGWLHVAYYQNETGIVNNGVLNAGTAKVYYTLSKDGGATWSAHLQVNDAANTLLYFEPPPDLSPGYYLIGDYQQIKATCDPEGFGKAYVLWTDYDKNRGDININDKRERTLCTTITDLGPCKVDCGDGVCDPGEDCMTCPLDCGPCPPCGDGICSAVEDCMSCPVDCGPCPICGDGVCDPGEDCMSCPADCGACPPFCGDGVCDPGEDCVICPLDCGPCPPPFCGDGVVNQAGEQCDPPDDAACPGQCIPPGLPNECTCPMPGNCVVFTDQAAFEIFNAEDGKFLKGIEDFEETAPGTGLVGFDDPLCGGIPSLPAPIFPNGIDQLNLCVQSNILGGAPVVPAPHGPNGLVFVEFGTGFGNNSDLVLANYFAESLDLMFTSPPVLPGEEDNHTGVGFDAVSIFGLGVVNIRVYDKNNVLMVLANAPANPRGVFWGVWCPDTIGRINIHDPDDGAQGADNIQMWTEELGIPNDDCADRIPIFDGLTNYDTTGATTDGLPHLAIGCQFDGQTYHDIWYNYVSTCTGVLNVTMCAPGDAFYDTDLVVYDGCPPNIPCPPGDADVLGCNDDDCVAPSGQPFVSRLPDSAGLWAMNVIAGNCYKIRVGGWNAGNQGPGTISIECKPPPSACTLFTNKNEFEAFNSDHGKLLKGIEFFEETAPGFGIVGFADPLCGGIPNPPFDIASGAEVDGLRELNLCVQSNTLGGLADVPSPHGPNGLVFIEFGAGFGENSDLVLANYFAESLDIMFGPPVPPEQQDNHTGVGFDAVSIFGLGVVNIRVYDKNNVLMVLANAPANPRGVFWGVWCPDTIGRINIHDPDDGAQGADNIQMWLEGPTTGACCDHAQPGGMCTDNVPPTACIGPQLTFFPGDTCANVEAAGLCEEHTGACCDHSQPGGSCTDGVPESDCIPDGGGGGGVGPHDVAAGLDLFMTPPGISETRAFNSGAGGNPIPADFFGPGSDPFDGSIQLQGLPLAGMAVTDTIVERLQDADFPPLNDPNAACPGAATIEIEIVALSLVSSNPIVVTFNGGQNPELWDVYVCLSDVPQHVGSMTLTHECPDGGTFDSFLPVLPKLIFTRAGTGPDTCVNGVPGNPVNRCIDAGLLGIPPDDFQAFGGWVHDPDDAFGVVTVGPGLPVDGNCDGVPETLGVGSSCFVPGIFPVPCDCNTPPGGSDQFKKLTIEQALLATHGVLPSQDPDGGGGPDPCAGGGDDQIKWFKDVTCDEIKCFEHTGACCDGTTGNCQDGVPESQCACLGTACPCDCDVDGNGICDPGDLGFVLGCFGSPIPPGCQAADLNCDGNVDDADVNIIACLVDGGPPEECCPSTPGNDQCRWEKDTLCSDLVPQCTEHTGACCDGTTGNCDDDVPESECPVGCFGECINGGYCDDPDCCIDPDDCLCYSPNNQISIELCGDCFGECFQGGYCDPVDPSCCIDPNACQCYGPNHPVSISLCGDCFGECINGGYCDPPDPNCCIEPGNCVCVDAGHPISIKLCGDFPDPDNQHRWEKGVSCTELDPPCEEHTGACCDGTTGNCEDGVPESECPVGCFGECIGGSYCDIPGDPDCCADPNNCPACFAPWSQISIELCGDCFGECFEGGYCDSPDPNCCIDPDACQCYGPNNPISISLCGDCFGECFKGGYCDPPEGNCCIEPGNCICYDANHPVSIKLCGDLPDPDSQYRWEKDTMCSDLNPPCDEHTGACCDGTTGNCQDNVPESQCACLGTACACDCDLNGDGICDPGADLVLLLGCFGSPTPPGCQAADLNCDGNVDDFDLDVFFCLLEGGLPEECCPSTPGTDQCRWEKDTLCIDLVPQCTEHTGACCDGTTGNCQDNVPESQCPVDPNDPNNQHRWEKDTLCSDLDPPCTEHTGACCDHSQPGGSCTDDVPESECLPGNPLGAHANGALFMPPMTPQTVSHDSGSGWISEDDSGLGGSPGCFCGTDLTTGLPVCWDDLFCDDPLVTPCGAGQGCPPGFACIVNNCCPPPQDFGCFPICPDGAACNNPGVCGTFEACEDAGDSQIEWFKDLTCDEIECTEHTGACCNGNDGTCLDNIPESQCPTEDPQFRWEKDTLCSDLVPPCEEHTGACCDHAQPGGQCTSNVPQSECLGPPEIFVTEDPAEFEAFMLQSGKLLKGIETFEEGIIPAGFFADLVDPLRPGVPNIDPLGFGFPIGLLEDNLVIQSNALGENAPVPAPGAGLRGVGPGAIGPNVPNSIVVGTRYPGQGGDGVASDSLDIIFTEPNHTGVGFEVIDPTAPPRIVHITVFNKNNQVIFKGDVPGTPEKVFFGIWSSQTIGRINLAGESSPGANNGAEYVDNIQMWLGGESQREWFKDEDCVEDGGTINCDEHTGACCDGTTGDCEDDVPESACPVGATPGGIGICENETACSSPCPAFGACQTDSDCGPGGTCLPDCVPSQCTCDNGDWICTDDCNGRCAEVPDQFRWEKDTLCAELDPPCEEHTGACCDGTTGNCEDGVPESECPVGCFGECVGGSYCDDPDCCVDPDNCPVCYEPNDQISIELCGDCFGECFEGGYCDSPDPNCCIDPDACQCYGPNNPISISLCGDCFGECFKGGYCDPPEGNCCIDPDDCLCYDANHPVSIKLCGDLPDPDSQYRWEKDTMCSDLNPPCEEHTGACCDGTTGNCEDGVPESECPVGCFGECIGGSYCDIPGDPDCCADPDNCPTCYAPWSQISIELCGDCFGECINGGYCDPPDPNCCIDPGACQCYGPNHPVSISLCGDCFGECFKGGYCDPPDPNCCIEPGNCVCVDADHPVSIKLCGDLPDPNNQHRWEKGVSCDELDPPCEEHTGACCDGTTGICESGVPESQCPVDPTDPNNQFRWEKGVSCDEMDPPCEEHTGACCDDITGECIDDVPESECPFERWEKDTLCDDLDPPCGDDCGPCPTDVNHDGYTNAFDLANTLGCWSEQDPCEPLVGVCRCLDADGNGCIDAFDLAVTLGSWGACCSDGLCLEGESCDDCIPADSGFPNECTSETWCSDGIDNDCDGSIDCDDSDCTGHPDCP